MGSRYKRKSMDVKRREERQRKGRRETLSRLEERENRLEVRGINNVVVGQSFRYAACCLTPLMACNLHFVS